MMNNNILLCSATEKGQPGSHLALSSGTKIWLWSDVNSGPLALYKAESTPSTAVSVLFVPFPVTVSAKASPRRGYADMGSSSLH